MSFTGSLYGAVVGARNLLYDRGILTSRKLAGPVVSVGNISTGGAGKTPFVILLGELLKQNDVPFDVLSRGYGRKTEGVLLVDPKGSAGEFGDEPLLISRTLGCPVVVGESRYQAGLFAEKNFGAQLHLLDDGFQHRSLGRDFDIVLLTPHDIKDELLPVGRLREPVSSLRRANAIVLSEDLEASDLPVPGKPIWRVHRDIQVDHPPERPIVFSGIARPQRFLDQLRSQGIKPVAEKLYRDHHLYSNSDIDDLLRLKAQHEADGFITTEKDAINLGPGVSRLEPVSVARVTMELNDPADTLDTILRMINNHKPQA